MKKPFFGPIDENWVGHSRFVRGLLFVGLFFMAILKKLVFCLTLPFQLLGLGKFFAHEFWQFLGGRLRRN